LSAIEREVDPTSCLVDGESTINCTRHNEV
jgi:hypothetical protein